MKRTYRTRPQKPLRTESIRTWQAAMDRLEKGARSPDHDASSAGRLEIAGEVKPFLADGHYVECRPFRDFSIRVGEAVELEVPGSLTGRSR
jgi:hypothetical protein